MENLNIIFACINLAIAIALIIWFSILITRINNTMRTTNYLISIMIGNGKSVTIIDKQGNRTKKLVQELAEEIRQDPTKTNDFNIAIDGK